jgi:hypothetical protein
MSLAKKIELLIDECHQLMASQRAFSFLPWVISSLQKMLDELKCGSARSVGERSKLAAGIFRLISDDTGFERSKLGQRILKVVDEYSAMQSVLAESMTKHKIRKKSRYLRR